MELHEHPVQGRRNKFVVTEEEAYFLAVASGDVPRFVDILAEVFNLVDSEVVKALDEMFDSGTLILGYLEADGGLDIHVPLERNEYVEKRLQEVFGG
ncbi:MAG: hypothetical protein M3P37_11855 [Actinomycetota bacterium]|nr:hypothetical protein [Actinomycetota bacterium]